MSTYILIFFPNIFYGKESKAESRIGNGMDGITEIFFDDVPYEIIATSYGRTGSKSGNSATWWINDSLEDVIGNPVMGYVNTRTASTMADAKGAIIVCTQRNGVITIPISITSTGTTGNCGLWLTAYRRIGTNE